MAMVSVHWPLVGEMVNMWTRFLYLRRLSRTETKESLNKSATSVIRTIFINFVSSRNEVTSDGPHLYDRHLHSMTVVLCNIEDILNLWNEL